MEFIERLMQKTVQLALPRRSKLKPKQKRLVRLGCAALAVMLAVGSVPFLRGFAAEEEASVSGSDIVSGSDGDIVSGSDGAVVIDGGTAEPKPAKSAIVALMMLAAYGVVYATRRRRAVSAKAAQ